MAKKAYLYVTTDSENSGVNHVELFHDLDALKATAKEDFECVVEGTFDETDLQYNDDGSIDYDDDLSGYTYDGVGNWTVASESEYEYYSTSGEVIEIVLSGPGSDTVDVTINRVE